MSNRRPMVCRIGLMDLTRWDVCHLSSTFSRDPEEVLEQLWMLLVLESKSLMIKMRLKMIISKSRTQRMSE